MDYWGLKLNQILLSTLLIPMNKARFKHSNPIRLVTMHDNSTLFHEEVTIAFFVDAKSLAFPAVERDLELWIDDLAHYKMSACQLETEDNIRAQ